MCLLCLLGRCMMGSTTQELSTISCSSRCPRCTHCPSSSWEHGTVYTTTQIVQGVELIVSEGGIKAGSVVDGDERSVTDRETTETVINKTWYWYRRSCIVVAYWWWRLVRFSADTVRVLSGWSCTKTRVSQEILDPNPGHCRILCSVKDSTGQLSSAQKSSLWCIESSSSIPDIVYGWAVC